MRKIAWKRGMAAMVLGLITAVTAPSASAALVLTQAGIDLGFGLNLFADQFPSTGFCCGPLGVATSSSGKILIQDYRDHVVASFNDANNQHYGDAVSSVVSGSTGYGTALTSANGVIYGTNDSAGGFVQRLNADGSFAANITVGGTGKGGIWTNPVNGHLLVSGYSAIWDVDPLTGDRRLVVSVDVDGVSVSQDGKVVYGATNGSVLGWLIADGTAVYNSGNIGSPDGTAVMYGTGGLAGSVIANGNDGTVRLLDIANHTSTIIASGGSRGDYVGLDLNDGTLLLTQTDSVYRLTCGAACSFVPPTNDVPEPGTWALALLALAGVRMSQRRT